jgi:DNA-binding NarL/FixJ family response regulator
MVASVIEAGLLAIELGMVKNTGEGSTLMSKQQHLVFGLLKEGKSVKEIASELQLGEASVRTHIARIKNKLNCPDILELRMRANSLKAM